VTERVREYAEQDLLRLHTMYQAQGYAYAWPDLDDPIFFSKKVLEVDGKAVMAILSRLTSEQYLLLDPHSDPRERWSQFKRLHRAVEKANVEAGLEDTHAFLPPDLAPRFGKRLVQLGWVKDTDWPCYSKVLASEREPEVAAEGEHGTILAAS
jgi:hypothetical protein